MNVQHREFRPSEPNGSDRPQQRGRVPEVGLFDALQFVLRRKYLILFAALLGLVTGIVVLGFSTPVYTASMRLMIDTRHQDSSQTQSESTFILDTSVIDSQLELIRSPAVLSRVAANLKLHEVPDFNGTSKRPFDVFMDDIWRRLGYPAPPPPVLSQEQRQRIATGIVGAGVNANRVGRSYIIQISMRSTNREWAARVANAVGEAYIEDQLDARYTSTRRATLWLQDRISELRTQANNAERDVLRYRMENNIIEIGQGGPLSNQQLMTVANQWMQARAQSAETRVRLERINEILASASNGRMPEATAAEINANPIIARLRNNLVDAAKRESDISTRFGRDHIQANALRAEMRGLQEAMLLELRRVVETVRSEHEISVAREASLRSSMDELIKLTGVTGEAQIPLRELETTAQSFRSLYDSFLTQQAQQNQRISFPRTDARVIAPAGTPWVPTEPNANRILLMSLLGGLALGVGAAFAREQLDRVFRTPRQVETVLGVECLGILPIVAGSAESSLLTRIRGDSDADQANRRSLMRHVIDQPFSRFAETLRSVKVTLDLSGLSRTTHVLAFVSGMPNEGKTTVAGNFAAQVASAGQKAILVDMDLRNPSLTRRLAPDAKVGLLEVIRGEVSLDAALIHDETTNLLFLPTVVSTRTLNTSEILASERMGLLVKVLRQRATYVILDLPPLAPIVDARAAVPFVDSFLLVVEWGQSRYDVLLEAMKSAPEVEDKMLGAVLNKTDMRALRRYDSHRDSYYENKYYKRYGYEN